MILGPDGNPVSSLSTRFYRGGDSALGSFSSLTLKDHADLLPQHDRRVLVAASRRLVSNMGLPRGAILQKAGLVVGQAWAPSFRGADREWGRLATEWLVDSWYPICDVRGPSFDFVNLLWIDSVAIDRDGDFFILLTKSENEFPQIQHIPSHRVGDRHASHPRGVVEGGTYSGLKIKDGVVTNPSGRPVAYQVLGDSRDEDQIISARNLIHVMDPEWHDQCRGVPAAAHAIMELLSSLRSHEWEQMAQMMLSSIGMVEYNEHGIADPDDPGTTLSTTSSAASGTPLDIQTFSGGTVRYFKANSGAKLEALKNDRPGDSWEKFQDRIARVFISGMNWSYAYSWKQGELNSVSNRAELTKVRNSVEDRQAVLRPVAKRVVQYAVAKAIKEGILPPSEDWWRWGFTMPPKVSIDPGRDTKANLELLAAGVVSVGELVEERGGELESCLRRRAHEAALKEQIRQEVEQEMGVRIDPREMGVIPVNNNQPAQQAPQQSEDDEE